MNMTKAGFNRHSGHDCSQRQKERIAKAQNEINTIWDQYRVGAITENERLVNASTYGRKPATTGGQPLRYTENNDGR